MPCIPFALAVDAHELSAALPAGSAVAARAEVREPRRRAPVLVARPQAQPAVDRADRAVPAVRALHRSRLSLQAEYRQLYRPPARSAAPLWWQRVWAWM